MPDAFHLSVEQVIRIQMELIDKSGGAHGIINLGLLESALLMPLSGVLGQTFFSTIPDLASAYFYYLIANHSFVDGNKRIGVSVSLVFLHINGYDLDALDEELEDLAIAVANGNLEINVVRDFFNSYTKKL